MSREDAIQIEGIVTDCLPKARYRIEFLNRHRITAHVPLRMQTNIDQIHVGEKVIVEMKPFDFSKGIISSKKTE